MGKSLKPVGGEFWFQQELFDSKIDNYNITYNEDDDTIYNKNYYKFLDGGQSSLTYIYESLDFSDDKYILMPSYLCPSILIKLDELKIKYKFYKINKDFTIDLKSIEDTLINTKVGAILFVNYFGFYHNEETLEYLKSLRSKNIDIIEDAVQMLWFDKQKKFIGDFIFNSYRKFIPLDGSVLIGHSMDREISTEPSKYAEVINKARVLKNSFIHNGIGDEQDFLNLYSEAEHKYYENIISREMIHDTKKLLNVCDANYISNRRINNFEKLEDGLSCVREITPLFNTMEIEAIPLGYVVFAEKRNQLRKFLRENNIFCPVHWNLNEELWAEAYDDSLFISNNILTIPIDQRYDCEDMERVTDLIKEFYSREVRNEANV